MTTKAWSAPATTRRVLKLLADLPWDTVRIADVGAGRGHFTHLVGDTVAARGLTPADHVFACDVIPESFAYDAIACRPIGPDGRLPFPDDWFDAVVSIEVVEHVEDQFAYLRELVRVARPGAIVIVTTPNVLNANSRLRAFLTGFPVLFDPLPLRTHDPRTEAGGHIHPVTPYYLAYVARRAGLEDLTFHPDRTKHSGAILVAMFAPAFALGQWLLRRRLQRKRPEVLAENHALLAALGGWGLLTCRTTVLRGVKPRDQQQTTRFYA